MASESFDLGEIVFVIVRNPHAQGVANVQEAVVVEHPDDPQQLSLFMYETYYPLTEEVAVYPSAFEADNAFRTAFGLLEMENLNG